MLYSDSSQSGHLPIVHALGILPYHGAEVSGPLLQRSMVYGEAAATLPWGLPSTIRHSACCSASSPLASCVLSLVYVKFWRNLLKSELV